MNLFEKLNRLDDSLVESKRVVKKKKLTESVEDETEDVYDDDIDEMLTEDLETSKAVKQGFQKILNNARKSVDAMLPALILGMVEYSDKYKGYLDKDDKEVVLQNINNLVKYINVELIDNLNKFANQLN